MNGIFFWLAAALAGLFFVAIVVAWWEHLGRRPPALDSSLPVAEPPAAPVTAVDLDLDRLPELPVGDAARRREALGRALERMTQPGALGEPQVPKAKTPQVRQVWVDTAPMVGPGAPQPSVPSEKTS